MGPHKVLVLSTAVLTLCWATPPPGYVKKPDNDKDPPKYEFGYDVRDGKGGRQGHLESRDGVYALGMYYVNLPDGSEQTVRYFADDWGYHPLVSYSSSSSTGSTKIHFALGEKAVNELEKSKDAARIPHIGPVGDAITSTSLKLPADVSSIIDNTGEVLKIRPGQVSSQFTGLGSARNKLTSSFQEISKTTDSQKLVEPLVSEVNNLVDSSIGGKESAKYNSVTPVYTASQLVSGSGYSNAVAAGSSDYESQQGYDQNDNTKETGSSSYQLVDIGSVSSHSGSGVSVSHSPLFLQLISESTNAESGRSPGYKNERKQKITTFTDNINSALKFGDKIPSTGTYSNQITSSVGQLQNEIHNKDQQTVQITPSPIPQTYSSLRPIVVAEIQPKNQPTLRPIIVSPISTTPVPIHISNSPSTDTSVLFTGSLGGYEHANIIRGQSVVNNYPSKASGFSSLQPNSGSQDFIGSVQKGYTEPVQQIIHTSPSPISVTYGQDISQSLSTTHGNSLVTNQVQAQPLVYTTPSPIQVSYSHDTLYSISGSRESSPDTVKQKNIVQAQPLVYTTPSPVPDSHVQSSSYSLSGSQGISIASTKQENVPYAQSLVYTTPSPAIVSYSHDISLSSAKDKGTSNSVITSNNGGSGHIISPASQTVSPILFLYPQSHVPPLFDVSTSKSNIGYVSSTPATILLSRPQDKETFSTEIHSQRQSFVTADSVKKGHAVSQYTTPSPLQLSSTPQPTSISVSNSISGSENSADNSNSVLIENSGIHSTTLRPIVSSTAKSTVGDISGNYLVSSTADPVYLNRHPSPTSPTLTSSVLAPIQAGVSLSSTPHKQLLEFISPIPYSAPEPPQVTEQTDDVPQPKTVVEIQKAISYDFNALTTKSKGDREKSEFITPTSHVPAVQNVQVSGTLKPAQIRNNQQNINTENLDLTQYSFIQPLIGAQVGFNQPLSISGQVLYSYNPQIFESQKLAHFNNKYRQQVDSGLQYGVNGQLFDIVKQEYPEKVSSDIIVYPEQQKQQQIVTEVEGTAGEYQYNQQLLALHTENRQQNQHEADSSKQQVTTTFNEQSASGEGQNLGKQLLPVAKQVQTQYSQQQVQSDQIQNYQPLQVYNEPLQINQQTEIQEPIGFNTQQQIKQVQYKTPIFISQHVEEQENNVQRDYNQQLISSSGFNQQAGQINTQTSQISGQASQAISQVQPAFNSNSEKIEQQLQTEYEHQLEEEEKQEQVKLGSKIKESVKQIPLNYKEFGEQEKHVDPSSLSFGDNYISSEQHINLIPFSQETKLLDNDKRLPEENTKIIEIEKPIPVHHTKVIEKPVAVPHAVPVAVTKLVAVERPVPYPQPYAVPHPYPVPYAVPHPIGVPVPHLVPYPHVVTLPYNEVHPVNVQGKPYKHGSVNYRYQVQNIVKDTPLPMIMKALHHHGGRYGYPVSVKNQYYHSSKIPDPLYLTPPPFKSSGRGRVPQRPKYYDHLRKLCIEYGFKPPLVPSKQIDGIPPSAYGPPIKE